MTTSKAIWYPWLKSDHFFWTFQEWSLFVGSFSQTRSIFINTHGTNAIEYLSIDNTQVPSIVSRFYFTNIVYKWNNKPIRIWLSNDREYLNSINQLFICIKSFIWHGLAFGLVKQKKNFANHHVFYAIAVRYLFSDWAI